VHEGVLRVTSEEYSRVLLSHAGMYCRSWGRAAVRFGPSSFRCFVVSAFLNSASHAVLRAHVSYTVTCPCHMLLLVSKKHGARTQSAV
jgi:hypothetical protein